MWIHLPTSVYTVEAADLTSASSWPFQTLEQSVTWKETRRRSRSWLTTCKRSNWMMRLSGQIPQPSKASDGADLWTSLLAASRANRGQSPGDNRDSMMSVGSGHISERFLGQFNPEGRFLKTSPDFFEADSDPSSVILPRSGSLRSGSLYAQPTSEHRIDASEFSSWPTATADRATYASGNNINLIEASMLWLTPKLSSEEEQAEANWPTATADSATSRSKRYEQGGLPLSMATEMWDTPDTMPEAPGTGSNRTSNNAGKGDETLKPPGLGNQAQWATPRSEKTTSENPEVWKKRQEAGDVSTPPLAMQAQQTAGEWRTPSATEADGGTENMKGDHLSEIKNPRMKLREQTSEWATPEARDYKGPTITPEHPEGFNKNLANDVADWPTPTTQEIAHPGMVLNEKGRREPKKGKTDHSLNLEDTASNWPTPTAMDKQHEYSDEAMTRKDGQSRMDQLKNVAPRWATPAARDHKDTGENTDYEKIAGKHKLAGEAVGWSTPLAADDGHKVTVNTNQSGLIGDADRFSGHQVQQALIGEESLRGDRTLPRLNPKFVEWLMGWPEDWLELTVFASSGTA